MMTLKHFARELVRPFKRPIPGYDRGWSPYLILGVVVLNMVTLTIHALAMNWIGTLVQVGLLTGLFAFSPNYCSEFAAARRRIWFRIRRYERIKFFIDDSFADAELDNNGFVRDRWIRHNYPDMAHVETGGFSRHLDEGMRYGYYGTAWFANNAAVVGMVLRMDDNRLTILTNY